MRKSIKYQLDIVTAILLRRSRLLAILLIICLPAGALAAMDYKCLNNCVSSGETTSVCMPKCSYGAGAESLKRLKQGNRNPYNQFSDREVPEVIKKYEEAEKAKQPVNYSCMPECLKNNLQYKFCEEKCREENPATSKYYANPDPAKKPL